MQRPGGWFNIKTTSYQYRKSHCGDKTILRPSYLHNGISYTGKMTSLYWIRPQNILRETDLYHIDVLVQDCSNSSALAMELLQSCGHWYDNRSPGALLRKVISSHYILQGPMSAMRGRLSTTSAILWLKKYRKCTISLCVLARKFSMKRVKISMG